MQITDRFFAKVNFTTDCWEWVGSLTVLGYGRFWNKKQTYAHRFVYELYHGHIDNDLIIHHKCVNRKCVNPNHLEQMKQSQHIKLNDYSKNGKTNNFQKSKTHCIRGHKFNEKNTYRRKDNNRQCKICRNESLKKHRRVKYKLV